MGISPQPLGAPNDSGGHLSTFPGGHALCLKSSSVYALLGTGIRLGSLGGRGNGTELLWIKEEHESECEEGRGEKAAAGPCLGVCSLLWVTLSLVTSSIYPPCSLVLGVWVEDSEGTEEVLTPEVSTHMGQQCTWAAVVSEAFLFALVSLLRNLPC